MKKVIALIVVAVLPAVLMIAYRMHQTTGFASLELIVYPLVFGGLGITVVVLLKRYYLREPLTDFNSRAGSIGSDILWALGLVAVYFLLFYIEQLTLRDLLTFRSNQELLGLMLDMRESPWMMLVWFGPVLWIGIALYEELVRAFLLTGLWSFSERRAWTIAVIIIAAVLVGLVHWSQGPYGIVTIATKSIVAGTFYLYRRRLLPLVLAHVLYDGLQVGALLMTYPH
ncbi:MAG: CPBP family intramembrane metalloprotease [Woeseiaceae bacterium]|nr:CPBP family intramembrane metalloprotease [Woeseiaceae bacterium]